MHDIRHIEALKRFELHQDGAVCELDYRREGTVVTFHHTGTPEVLRGQGLAGHLVQAGLQWARAQGLQVVPVCSYVATYIRRHPEWLDLLA